MHRLTDCLVGFVLLSLLTVFFGCQQQPDFDQLEQEILDLHRAGIQAHLDKDVGFFARDISDDYFSVGRGEIQRPSREEISANFKSYLNATTFTRYEDLQEPIIGFSDDGSLAWSIVQVKVEGTQDTSEGTPRALDFTCAWITLYHRRGEHWIRMGEVSSFR